MNIGDLVRPLNREVIVYIQHAWITVGKDDIGVLTYFREDNFNIEVLCRGQVCQSDSTLWRKLQD